MTFIPNISPFKYSKPEACTLASVTFSPLFRPGRESLPHRKRRDTAATPTPQRPLWSNHIFRSASPTPQPPNSPKMLSLGLVTEENFEQQREYVYGDP
jgi:hypothetical protein